MERACSLCAKREQPLLEIELAATTGAETLTAPLLGDLSSERTSHLDFSGFNLRHRQQVRSPWKPAPPFPHPQSKPLAAPV
jgi:hypothetical protein